MKAHHNRKAYKVCNAQVARYLKFHACRIILRVIAFARSTAQQWFIDSLLHLHANTRTCINTGELASICKPSRGYVDTSIENFPHKYAIEAVVKNALSCGLLACQVLLKCAKMLVRCAVSMRTDWRMRKAIF